MKKKQVPEREQDDMDLVLEVDVSEGTMKQLKETRQFLTESTFKADVIDETLKRLEKEKLPFFKYVSLFKQ